MFIRAISANFAVLFQYRQVPVAVIRHDPGGVIGLAAGFGKFPPGAIGVFRPGRDGEISELDDITGLGVRHVNSARTPVGIGVGADSSEVRNGGAGRRSRFRFNRITPGGHSGDRQKAQYRRDEAQKPAA